MNRPVLNVETGMNIIPAERQIGDASAGVPRTMRIFPASPNLVDPVSDQIPKKTVPEKIPSLFDAFPARGTTGPVRIGTLMEPMQRIIRHPDRNRLIAELFKDYR